MPTPENEQRTGRAGSQLASAEPGNRLSPIGPYQPIELIGEGGFGQVFLALKRDGSRPFYAVKVIHPLRVSNAALDRFANECAALQQMDHPGIVRLIDANVEGSPHYLVMEFVRGHSIDQHCEQLQLNLADRLDLLITVCEAVSHAHANKVLHRDLKPSNVLVKDDGQVKVIDFGIAKALQHGLFPATVETTSSLFVGSRPYASPEQVSRGELPIDQRTDVYGLGILSYEILSGALPDELDCESDAELTEVIRNQPFKRPSVRLRMRGEDQLGYAIAHDLDAIILKCLEKEPRRRYQTTEALLADLQRFKLGEPVQAHPPSTLYQTRKFMLRYRKAFTAAAVVLLLLAMLTVFSLYSWSSERHSRQLAQDRALQLQLEKRETEAALARASAAEMEAKQQSDVVDEINRFLIEDFVRPPEKANIKSRQMTRHQGLVKAAELASKRFVDRPAIRLGMHEAFAMAFQGFEDNERAAEHYRLAAEVSTIIHGDQHPRTIANRLNEANCYVGSLYRAEQGLTIIRSIVERQRKLPTSDASRQLIVESLNALGKACVERRQCVEAVDVLTESRQLQIASGADRFTLALAERELAVALTQADRRDRAIEFMRHALAELVEIDKDHRETLFTRYQLACLMCEMRKLDEAERVYQDNYQACCRVLGDDHVDTIRNLVSWAGTVSWRGDKLQAEQMYLRALAAEQQLRADAHSGDLVTLSHYARLLRDLERQEEAVKVQRYVIDRQSESLGDVHGHTIGSLRAMASIFRSSGEYGAELSWQLRSLWARIRYYGVWHDATHDTAVEIGRSILHLHGQTLGCRRYLSAVSGLKRAMKSTHSVSCDIPYVVVHPGTKQLTLTWIPTTDAAPSNHK